MQKFMMLTSFQKQDCLERYGPNVSLDSMAFAHPTTQLYGKVMVGAGSSLWPNVVVRAEMFEVRIGLHTNIQDFSMVHVGSSTGTSIGNYCSITHHCTIHGCKIGDNCLIGINATIMDGAVIGSNSVVAGGAFVTEGMEVPPNSVVIGMPAKVHSLRNNFVANRFNAFMYSFNAAEYAKGNHRGWVGKDFENAAQTRMKEILSEFKNYTEATSKES